MAAASHVYQSPTGYSTLKVVDPPLPPFYPEAEGLQASHPYGDENFNGKEVVKESGIEVTRDDDKELSVPTDIEKVESGGRKEWRKRRVCGIPILPFIALILLLVVGAIVGGAVGGTLGKKTGTNAAPPAPPPPQGPTTTAPLPARTANFEYPTQNNYYRVINEAGNQRKALQAFSNSRGTKVIVADISDTTLQHWAFPKSSPGENPHGYYFSNRAFDDLGKNKINAMQVLKSSPNVLNVIEGNNKRAANVVWLFDPGAVPKNTSMLIVSEVLVPVDYWLGYDVDGNAMMKKQTTSDTWWYLEEVD